MQSNEVFDFMNNTIMTGHISRKIYYLPLQLLAQFSATMSSFSGIATYSALHCTIEKATLALNSDFPLELLVAETTGYARDGVYNGAS